MGCPFRSLFILFKSLLLIMAIKITNTFSLSTASIGFVNAFNFKFKSPLCLCLWIRENRFCLLGKYFCLYSQDKEIVAFHFYLIAPFTISLISNFVSCAICLILSLSYSFFVLRWIKSPNSLAMSAYHLMSRLCKTYTHDLIIIGFLLNTIFIIDVSIKQI